MLFVWFSAEERVGGGEGGGEEVGQVDGGRGGEKAREVGDMAQKRLGRMDGAECIHGHGAVALGETLPGGVAEQGQVGKFGHGIAQEAVEVNLLGCGEQQVVAAHYFRDAHQGIVDYYGELIGPGAVGTAEYEVAAVCGEVDALRAADAVGERYRAVGNVKPRGGGTVVGDFGGSSEVWRPAGTLIDYAAVGFVGRLGGEYVGAAAYAAVGQPFFFKAS